MSKIIPLLYDNRWCQYFAVDKNLGSSNIKISHWTIRIWKRFQSTFIFLPKNRFYLFWLLHKYKWQDMINLVQITASNPWFGKIIICHSDIHILIFAWQLTFWHVVRHRPKWVKGVIRHIWRVKNCNIRSLNRFQITVHNGYYAKAFDASNIAKCW